MFYQAEDSDMRARINHQSVIQTDLALSEIIGNSDSDSEDSIYARSTVREYYEVNSREKLSTTPIAIGIIFERGNPDFGSCFIFKQ